MVFRALLDWGSCKIYSKFYTWGATCMSLSKTLGREFISQLEMGYEVPIFTEISI